LCQILGEKGAQTSNPREERIAVEKVVIQEVKNSDHAPVVLGTIQ